MHQEFVAKAIKHICSEIPKAYSIRYMDDILVSHPDWKPSIFVYLQCSLVALAGRCSSRLLIWESQICECFCWYLVSFYLCLCSHRGGCKTCGHSLPCCICLQCLKLGNAPDYTPSTFENLCAQQKMAPNMCNPCNPHGQASVERSSYGSNNH